MDTTCSCSLSQVKSLYEQNELSLATGGTLRPGGLALTTEILDCCKLRDGAKVLDVGCGPGHTVELMSLVFHLESTGLDPSPTMLAKAAELVPGATFLQGEATAIPCRSKTFEMVISECVLSLTDDIDTSLREMNRVLQPSGLLILTDIYRKQAGMQPALPKLRSCITHALPLEIIKDALFDAGFSLRVLCDRTDLLKQLAGQIIFSYGSLEKFWQLFLGAEEAQQTCRALSTSPLGYYMLIAEKV